MHSCSRRQAPRVALLMLLLAGLVILLGGCSHSQNSSSSESKRIAVSVEQAAAVLSVQSSAAEMYSGGPQGRTASTAQQVGEWLRKQGEVASVEVSETGTIWVEYACGLLAVILSPNTGANPEIWNGAPSAAGSSAAESTGATKGGIASLVPASASRGPSSSDLTPTSKRAAVFAFDEDRRPSGDLRSALRQAGYTLDDKDVFVGEAFTVESLRTLGAYGVVYFNTHGETENSKSGGYTILCTGKKATPEIIHGDWDTFVSGVRDLSGRATHGVGVATVPGANPPTHWLMITNRFLYLNGVELQNTLIMNNACSSLKNADMAESFLNAGAAMYVGWTNTSDCRHAEPMSAGLIRALSRPGTTFADAWSTKAIALSEWSEAYSAAELFPMVALKDSNGNGSPAYTFRNGVRWGDPADTGAEYGCSLVYTPQAGADRFVLVPRSSEGTPKLSLSGGSLPEGQTNTPYSTNLSATGGVAPLSWRVTSGSPPGGLALDGTSGAISGTPTKAGTSTFSIEVSDGSSPRQTAVAQVSVTISNAAKPSPTGGDLPGQQIGPSSGYSSAGYTILVWRETSSSGVMRVCGSRVDRDGRVLDPTPLEIATSKEHGFSTPAVCFGASSWLVTWLEQGGETRIRAARVAPDGTVYDKSGLDVGIGCDEQWFGNGYRPSYRPSVAWTGSAWLIMYGVDAGSDDLALVVSLVGEDGSVLTPEPVQWGRTATRGSLLFGTVDSVRTLEDNPFCVPGRSGYAILADIFVSDGEATYWGAPRVNIVAGSGMSVSSGWLTLQDEGQYHHESGDSLYDIAGCFGLTRWLVAWSLDNDYRDIHEARLAALESTDSGTRVAAITTLAEQESWHPVGLSIAAPGDKDEWFVTWIAERPRDSGRDIMGSIVNSRSDPGQPRVIMALPSSDDEYDSGDGVATSWNGRQYIVAHGAQTDGEPAQILVTCVAAGGSPGMQTAIIGLQGNADGLAASCDRAIPAPDVPTGSASSVPEGSSATAIRYLAPTIPGMCLELRSDHTLRKGMLTEDGTGFEDAGQGRWSVSGDEITLDVPLLFVSSTVHGKIVQDGLVFEEERQMSALGDFSVAWVREGAPALLDVCARWRRVDKDGDARERLSLYGRTYELTTRDEMTDFVTTYEEPYTWDGRTARLKTPWFDADVTTWDYVYLDGRLYHWDMYNVEIWECVDKLSATPTTPATTTTPTTTRPATPTTPATSATPATTTPTTTPATKPATSTSAPVTTAKPASASIVWNSIGPEGGPIHALVVNPATPTTLYAGTDGGVFRSTDAGGHWVTVNSGLKASEVDALAIDPKTPTILYAGTYFLDVLYKSTDGGEHWIAANTGLNANIVEALVIDPTVTTTLYAGTYHGGVFKSTDGAEHWSAVNTGLTGADITALAIDPTTRTTLYVGTYQGGVFRSMDGGQHWSAANVGLASSIVQVLVVDPTTPTTLYAGTDRGLFKSTDSAEHWTAANSGLTIASIEILVIAPTTPTTLYAGADGGTLFKSVDDADHWTAVSSGLTCLAIDPAEPTTLYAGTSVDAGTSFGGVFRSTDGAEHWSVVNTGLNATHVEDLAIDPASPTTLYVGTYRSGVFKSTDGGGHWSTANTGLNADIVEALVIDPTVTTTLYAGTYQGGVFKSTDGAEHWSAANDGLPVADIQALAISPVTPTRIYVGTYLGGVFRSSDGGGHWSAANSGLDGTNVTSLAIDPSMPTTLYAGTFDGGVFKSTDGGEHWSVVSAGLTDVRVEALAIDPSMPTTLYAGTFDGGVFKSTDGGAHWRAVNTGLTAGPVRALAIDQATPGTLYAATWRGGVCKSVDGGEHWSAINTGLSVGPVYALAIDPATPTTLYAGSSGGGAWTTNQGLAMATPARTLASSATARPTTTPATTTRPGTPPSPCAGVVNNMPIPPSPLPTSQYEVARFGEGFVMALQYSPDGRWLAVATTLGVEIRRGDTLELEHFLDGHTLWVNAVAFSPDGATLASAAANTVRLWDVATGSLLRTLGGHTHYVYSVVFSPDGHTIATGSGDDTIRLWDVATGGLLSTLSECWLSATSIAFTPDGKILTSVSSIGNTMRTWNVVTGELLSTQPGATYLAESAAINPDGMTVASGTRESTVKVWTPADGSLVQTYSGQAGIVSTVAFSSDGKTIASGSENGTIMVWNASSGTGELLADISADAYLIRSLAFSPDGSNLASASASHSLRVWDVASGSLLSSAVGHVVSSSAVFSPDGKVIATGAGVNGTVELWDAATGALLTTLFGHTDSVRSVAFSPDGKTLASSSQDKTIKLWNLKTGQVLLTLSGHAATVLSIAFSPDGKTLVSGSGDQTVKLWDVPAGELLRTLSGHMAPVYSVAFSPDGATLASGGGDNTVRLWSAATGALLHTLSGHEWWVVSVAFSPDGKTVASGSTDDTIKLWDVATGGLASTLSGHSRWVNSVAFSPDGKIIASASEDTTVRLWDVTTGAVLVSLAGHLGSVVSVAFSPDGKTLASAAGDGTVRVWDPRPMLTADAGALRIPETTTATTAGTTTTKPATTTMSPRTSAPPTATPTTTTPTTASTPLTTTATSTTTRSSTTPAMTTTAQSATPGIPGSASVDPCSGSTGQVSAEYSWTYQLLPKTLATEIPASLICESERADVPRRGSGHPYSELSSLVSWKGDDAFIAQLAREINRGYTDYYEIATNTLHFVQGLMPYTKEIGDNWQLPVETLARQKGDCEDGSVLYVALMAGLGYSDSVRLGVYGGHAFALVEVTSSWKLSVDWLPNKCRYGEVWAVMESSDGRLWAIAETTIDPSLLTLGYWGLGCGSIPDEEWDAGRVVMLAPDSGEPMTLVDVSQERGLP
jgi:WD40 repeat protein/photosystem II stability/assembly factor-like uncharacterized protein